MTGRSGIITGKLNQTAVYWPNPTADGFGGRTFDTAVEISVRWQGRMELFTDATGQQATSVAVIYANQDVEVGGYLYLGTLTELSSSEGVDPQEVATAYEIRAWNKTPDLAAAQELRKIWL